MSFDFNTDYAFINEKSLRGEKALTRVDYNIKPKSNNFFRLDSSLLTLDYLLRHGKKPIIISHNGRYKKGKEPNSLSFIVEKLEDKLKQKFSNNLEVKFLPYDLQLLKKESRNLKENKLILFENTRWTQADEMNDSNLARLLSETSDFFVLDTLSVAHRDNASVTGVMNYLPSYLGLSARIQLKLLKPFFNNYENTLYIIGGAKLKEKLEAVEYFGKFSPILLGGVVFNILYEQAGHDIGDSLKTDNGGDFSKQARRILDNIPSNNLLAPKILICYNPVERRIKNIDFGDDVPPNYRIVDLHFQKIKLDSKKISRVLHAGAMSWTEGGFTNATKEISKILTYYPHLICGDDSRTAIQTVNPDLYLNYSTAGGAALKFLIDKDLIALKKLRENNEKWF